MKNSTNNNKKWNDGLMEPDFAFFHNLPWNIQVHWLVKLF